MRIVVWTVVIGVTVLMAYGCMRVLDPETGKTRIEPTPALDTGIAAIGKTATEIAPAVTTGVAAISPPVAGVIGAVLSAVGVGAGLWKQWRTPLVEQKRLTLRIAMGARAAAEVIEKVVKPVEDKWVAASEPLAAAKRNGAIMPHKIGNLE